MSPARRKSVLAPILNKIKNGAADASDSAEKKLGSESSGSGHIAVQIEPARRVKVGSYRKQENKIVTIKLKY